MTKPEAAKAFLEIAALLRHENLLTGTVKAALRGEQDTLFVAELDGKDITIQELASQGEQEPFLAAFAVKRTQRHCCCSREPMRSRLQIAWIA